MLAVCGYTEILFDTSIAVLHNVQVGNIKQLFFTVC